MKRFTCSCLHLTSVFPLLLLLLFLSQNRLAAQGCDPQNDTIPPTAVCDEFTVVAIGVNDPNDCYAPTGQNQYGGVTWVKALTFDDGSYDNCSNPVKLTVRRQAPYSNCIQSLNATNGHLPCDDMSPDFPSEFERAVMENDSIKFYGCEVGSTQTVILNVYQLDDNGNIALHNGNPIVNSCLISVEVVDKIKPVCQPPANVTVSCENFDPSLAAHGQLTTVDNCCLDTATTTLNYSLFDTVCNKGTITRTFRVYDCSANSSQCTQRIEVNYNQHYFLRFPNDLITVENPGGNYGEPTFFGEDCELIGVAYSDQVFTTDPNADYRLERTWTIINWCTYNPNLGLTIVPNPNPNATTLHPSNLPGPTISAPNTIAPWNATISKIFPSDPVPTDFSSFWAADANGYQYTQIMWLSYPASSTLAGKVFSDSSGNCVYEAGETPLNGWEVEATGSVTGKTYLTYTDASGNYELHIHELDTTAEVTLTAPFNFGQNCPEVYIVNLVVNETTTQNIPVHLETECPLLSVDLAASRMRRCFPGTYTVQNCNLGTQLVEDAHVEVTLDNYLVYQGGSIAGTNIGGNTYSFDLGDMAVGECRNFTISFVISCDAPLGFTHCTDAHIFPDSLCQGQSAAWSGADVEVTGYCDGDSVRMAIANVGTGDMAQVLDFVVVEDVIMYNSGTFQLPHDGIKNFSFPANGATWRLQAEEEINHPWGGVEAKAIEGCGGLNETGLVTIFNLNTPDPFETTHCEENVGSYDPNDKQAFPKGFGSAHLLNPNTDIEYLIRFQNTGTDTAFTVVVLDTISAYLDAQMVRPGASSHPYTFAVLDDNVLRFRFDNILLPDSNVNEAASNGFVKFRLPQMPDNPNGTLIENRAAIYFDFNDPVLTNTTSHVIQDYITGTRQAEVLPVGIRPNPVSDVAVFELPASAHKSRFELRDVQGQLLRTEWFSGTRFRFERLRLPAGAYFFSIVADDRTTYGGKVLLK